jgi:tripartite ATP-independent transporter DctM subunit
MRQAMRIVVESFWGLLTVVIIIGGILSGVFTPTEAGSVACLYAFLITMFVYRECRWSDLPKLLARVVRTVGMVMIMIGFSVAFAYAMALIQLPAKATDFFLSISDDKYVFLMLINILLLLLGTFMDLAPMLLICTPILLPVILKFGIDPVHFGMVMLLNLGIGLVTPPVGPTMVVGAAIGGVTMEQITRHIWPFYLVMPGQRRRRAAGDRHSAGPKGRSGSATAATCCGATSPTTASALGRGDRRRQRLPPAVQQRQRQHPRPPGPARHLRARHPPRHAHRV